jgi:hypothetical protein
MNYEYERAWKQSVLLEASGQHMFTAETVSLCYEKWLLGIRKHVLFMSSASGNTFRCQQLFS